MAIVKMKRIRLIALAKDRDALLSGLLHVGCVEVREPTEQLSDEGCAALLHRDTTDLTQIRAELSTLQHALDVLGKYAPQKAGLFAIRPTVSEEELMDRRDIVAVLETASEINGHAQTIGRLAAAQGRLNNELLALRPWADYQLPLEQRGTRTTAILLGTLPVTADLDLVAGALAEAAEAAQLTPLSEDREQRYVELIVHRSQEQAALETLRAFGFSFSQLRDMTGTVAENIRRLEDQIEDNRRQSQREANILRAMGSETKELQLCMDRIRQQEAQESVKERLLTGGSVIYLDGWVDRPNVSRLANLLVGFDCAYELTDPAEEDYPQVPVKLENNKLTRSMNVVTEMYSLPAYDGTDPNPLMFPFFVLFFGMMMADMAYGILMIAAAVFMLRRQPKESTRNFMEGVLWCGISTVAWGAATGGFFGDFIPQLLQIIDPESTFQLPALFTPLDDTIAIMVGSLVLGAVQIVTGMTVSIINKLRAGDFLDALFDEITWWIILTGVGLLVLGIGTVRGVPVVLVLGLVMLVFGGTRQARGFGKVTKLVGLVYNGVTGFFSDIMSYVRLMALMLSGSVIASVFNTLAATFGSVILFILISMVGNALNLALNLLGCYVHDLRLQCLEFFNRFYKEGGKPYRPLAIQTKYVNVMKEEN